MLNASAVRAQRISISHLSSDCPTEVMMALLLQQGMKVMVRDNPGGFRKYRICDSYDCEANF